MANLDRLIEAGERDGFAKIKTIVGALVATAKLLPHHADPVLAGVRGIGDHLVLTSIS